jgi:DNA-binding transcriptional MerR regulator
MAEKSPDAFRTISEVSEVLDIPAHVLRFWESRFTQIKPVKRGGGRRYYRPQDISLLRGIRDLLYSDGLTIKGVQKILREKGVRHVASGGGVPVAAESAPAPAPPPAPRPATEAPRRAAAPPVSDARQGSLFGEPASDVQAMVRPKQADRGALRAILGRLEELRDAMKAHPF